MFGVEEIIQKNLEEQRKLRVQYGRRLQELPDAALTLNTKKGEKYYHKIEEGRKIYLGKISGDNREEILNLQTKRYLKKAMSQIDGNCKVMQNFLKKYESICPEEINKNLPKAYQLLSNEEYAFIDRKDLDRWANTPYDRNMNYPEHLKHRTVKGDLVRSKSEVIIADMLFLRGKAYHYEEKIQIGRQIFAPDFKVAVESKKKFILIEHLGMISDLRYLDDNLRKIGIYIENGYVPWRDIIFTYDDIDGGIDAQTIDWIITKFCS